MRISPRGADYGYMYPLRKCSRFCSSLFQSYTAYMIAIANNAVNMETLLTKLSDGKPLGEGLADKLCQLKNNSLDYLCEEVLTDIKVLMPDIMTRKWLTKEAQTIGT